MNKLRQSLPKYNFNLVYNDYNIPTKICSEAIDIDLFVNDEATGNNVVLEGLPIPKLCTLIERERRDVGIFLYEQHFASEQGHKDMAREFGEKIKRKALRVDYMEKIGREMKIKHPDFYNKLF